ncbi:MAG: CmcI family methyltransferase [Elusimicrobiota bacterium]
MRREHVAQRGLRRLLSVFPPLDFPARFLAGLNFKWTIPTDGTEHDLKKYRVYPLIAWFNYHQHEVLGKQCKWLGKRALKNPLDAWIYQEIIWEVRPDLIIELGNKNGGSTLFLANICDLIGHGEILALDLDHKQFTAEHSRIRLLTGDCSSEPVLNKVREYAKNKKVLVIHDADHTRKAVLRDLRLYAEFVSPCSYLIVEDTMHGISGFNSESGKKPGVFTLRDPDTPLQAIEEFLKERRDFTMDRSRERYILTSNYKGYLRRKPD